MLFRSIEDTKLPFTYQENKDLGEILINDILRGGNFGYHADDFNRPKNVVSRKINTAGMMISRSFKYYKFSPSETKWYPLRYSYESVKVILGLKN